MNIVYRNRIKRTITNRKEIIELLEDKNIKLISNRIAIRIDRIINGGDMNKSELMRKIKSLFNYGKTQSKFSKYFWKIRGWSNLESEAMVSDIQKRNGEKFSEKVKSGIISHNLSKEYLKEQGKTEEEASVILTKRAKFASSEMIRDRTNNPDKYKSTSPTQIAYWIKKGISEDDAKIEVSKRQSTFSLDKCLNIHGKEEGIRIWKERQLKWFKSFRKNNLEEIELKKKSTRIEKGLQIPDESLSDRDRYYREVWKHTNRNAKFVKNIEKRSLHFHLDHKFSVKEGFINNVPPYIIGSINNLEILPSSLNCKKQSKCSISLKELFRTY